MPCGAASLARSVIELLSGLDGPARIRPAADDLSALIDALLGMTVWALPDEATEAHPVHSERIIGALTAVWRASVWGRTP
jgi:hypothetical protein